METDSGTAGDTRRTAEDETVKELKEVREQFEAYRKEMAENRKMMEQQLEEKREQASTTRLDNAKLSSKVS